MNEEAILLSGGVDSIALSYWLRPKFAFTVDYGQFVARAEKRAARKIAELLSMEHHVISVDCSGLGSGDLVNRTPAQKAPISEWWPFRNQLLATLAGMRAIDLGVSRLLFGSVNSDASHRDGTAEFYRSINQLMCLQEGEVQVAAPAVGMTTEELVKVAGIGLEYLAWAHSCHVSNWACGDCRGCFKHQTVMEALGYGCY